MEEGVELDLILQAAWGQGARGEVQGAGPETVSEHACLCDDAEGYLWTVSPVGLVLCLEIYRQPSEPA